MAVSATEAGGTAECAAALAMMDQLAEHGIRPRTLGADRGYDSGPWFIELESRGITPHAAMRSGVIGGAKGTTRLRRKNRPLISARERMQRRTRGWRYRLSQRARKKVEEGFSWWKTVAGLARTRLVGRWKIQQQLELASAAFNLVRMSKLLAS